MNTAAGLSSCQMIPAPAASQMPGNLLHLANHCPECQPFAVSDFCASATAVAPPATVDNPLSITAARNHRDQARRRPNRRAA